MDVKSFMELVIDNLAGIVQYNGLQNQDIFSVCAVLTDESVGSPLERLAAINTLMLSEVSTSQNNPSSCSSSNPSSYSSFSSCPLS